jgi:aldose 1-epimerase
VPDDTVILRAGNARLDVAVEAGGRIAQIEVGQTLLLFGGEDDRRPDSTGWGSFPMAPWAGRIRHGRLRFLGQDVALTTNHRDGDQPDRAHAIHGTVFQRPWTVTTSTSTRVEMNLPLGGALGWPFGGTAHQIIDLFPQRVECRLTITADETVFPGDIGWHPWFAKPDRLDFHPLAMYRRDPIGLPTGELVVPTPPPWDDCFVNTAPVVLGYQRESVPQVTITSDCDHYVVYDEPAYATCVEPQSGPPDSPTIRPRLIAPGHPLERSMTIAW